MRSGRGGEVLGSKHQTGAGDVAEKPADKKFLDDITVKEIVEDCQVNRQTFYYHFQDIYDLLRFFLDHETQVTVAGSANCRKRCCAASNTPGSITSSSSTCSAPTDGIIWTTTSSACAAVSQGALRACSPDLTLEEPDLAFLSDFYMYALGGLIMGWLSDDMKEEPEALVERISRLLDGEFRRAAETFARRVPRPARHFNWQKTGLHQSDGAPVFWQCIHPLRASCQKAGLTSVPIPLQ